MIDDSSDSSSEDNYGDEAFRAQQLMQLHQNQQQNGNHGRSEDEGDYSRAQANQSAISATKKRYSVQNVLHDQQMASNLLQNNLPAQIMNQPQNHQQTEPQLFSNKNQNQQAQNNYFEEEQTYQNVISPSKATTKRLPYIEDIYDMETEDLEKVLAMIRSDMLIGEERCVLPQGVTSFEKYERKAAKLKDCLELELDERAQVDNVVNFFESNQKKFLDDDAFYKLDNLVGGGQNHPSTAQTTTQSSTDTTPLQQLQGEESSQQLSQKEEKTPENFSQSLNSNSIPISASKTSQKQQTNLNQPITRDQIKNLVTNDSRGDLLRQIDPARLLDDVQSEYSASQMKQQSQVRNNLETPQRQSDYQQEMLMMSSAERNGESGGMTPSSSSAMGAASKARMTKQQLAAFMKEKLQKTKVNKVASTGVSASGPAQKNFHAPRLNQNQPLHKRDLITVGGPKKQSQKSQNLVQNRRQNLQQQDASSSGSEDDIAAANARMMEAAQKFRQNSSSQSSSNNQEGGSSTTSQRQGSKNGPRRVERQYKQAKNEDFEERKTTVVNTSKNIYKPCFKLPPKEPKNTPNQAQIAKKNAKKPVNPRDAAKAYGEQQRIQAKQKRESSAARQSETQTDLRQSKAFSKPNLASSKSSRSSAGKLAANSSQKNLNNQLKANNFVQKKSKDEEINQETQLESDNVNFAEEIESKYSDEEQKIDLDKVNSCSDQQAEKLFTSDITPIGKIAVENLDQTQETDADLNMLEVRNDNELGTATFGDKLMSDLKVTEVKLDERPTSTADLLLQRAKDKGDFNSYPIEEDLQDVKDVESDDPQKQQTYEQIDNKSDRINQNDDQSISETVGAKGVSDEAFVDYKEANEDEKVAKQNSETQQEDTRQEKQRQQVNEDEIDKVATQEKDGKDHLFTLGEQNEEFEESPAKIDDPKDLESGQSILKVNQNESVDKELIKQPMMNATLEESQDFYELGQSVEKIDKICDDTIPIPEQLQQQETENIQGQDKQSTKLDSIIKIDQQEDLKSLEKSQEFKKVEKQDELETISTTKTKDQSEQAALGGGKKKENAKVAAFDRLMSRIKDNPEQKKKEQEDRMKKIEEKMALEKSEKKQAKESEAKKAQIKDQDQAVTKKQSNDQAKISKEIKGKSLQTTSEKPPAKAETKKIDTGLTKKKLAGQGSRPNQFKQAPRSVVLDEKLQDYSHLYRNFYDIFVGCHCDQKGFDLNFAIRESRNVYAQFVNLMENQLLMGKHKFSKHPLEHGYKDFYGSMLQDDQNSQQPGQLNHFNLVGQNLNALEAQMKARDTLSSNQNGEGKSIKQQQKALMMAAMTQATLREKYKQMKDKSQEEIARDAQLIAQGAPQPAESIESSKQTNSVASSLVDPNRQSQLYFRVIKTKTEVYDIITRSFSRKSQWNELPHGLDLRNSWNLMWVWSKIKSDISRLLVWQRCNHFLGAKNVSRKDFLKRNIERAMKFSPKSKNCFDIMPLTFVLPKEYVSFLETFSDLEDQEGKFNYWIMKPAAKSRGRGISVVNDISQVTYGEPMILQKYVKNPLLLNGYKFDLRIYILVTSVNPLEAFIYKEGFGRFSTQPYTLDPSDKANKYIHLTNVSINKYNLNNYDVNAQDRIYGGSKVSLGTLRKTFNEDLNIDWDGQIWTQIKAVCLKALVAAQNDIQYSPCCFDLYGFDVIIDEDLKCWLLEINSSPSFSTETLLDDMIKQRLVDDTIDLVNPVDFDRKRLFEVLERRTQEEFNGAKVNNGAHQKRSMNRDLTYILNGQMPRGYGEIPSTMGNYELLAPNEQSETYLKLVGGQKMFGSAMKLSEKIPLPRRQKVKGVGSMPAISEKGTLMVDTSDKTTPQASVLGSAKNRARVVAANNFGVNGAFGDKLGGLQNNGSSNHGSIINSGAVNVNQISQNAPHRPIF